MLNSQPFALVDSADRGLVLTALNRVGLQAGLVVGMTLTDARARVPGLVTEPADLTRDAADLKALALWCQRYGPSVNVDDHDGVWIDVSGVAHLFGGEAELLADLVRRLAQAGLTAQVGLADTIGAAWAVARFGARGGRSVDGLRACVVPSRQNAQVLERLPVAALRLDEARLTLLRRLGLNRVGDLFNLPRVALKRRFPSRAAAEDVLSRLDQALGRVPELAKPLVEPPEFIARCGFAEPLISTEPVEAAVRGLCADLCAQLMKACAGVRQAQLAVFRTDGSVIRIDVGCGRPCQSADHLMRLFAEKLGEIDAGFGIDLIQLGALTHDRVQLTQHGLSGAGAIRLLQRSGQQGDLVPECQDLVDRIANRVGSSCVYRLTPVASHVPERGQMRVSPDSRIGQWCGRQDIASQGPDDAQLRVPRRPARPAFLLKKPEFIQVLAEIPEGPPAQFVWRRVTRRIVRADGPERIASEWWRHLGMPGPDALQVDEQGEGALQAVTNTVLRQAARDQRARDYYRLEDEQGGAYWVFRQGLYQAADEQGVPDWFMHGVYF